MTFLILRNSMAHTPSLVVLAYLLRSSPGRPDGRGSKWGGEHEAWVSMVTSGPTWQSLPILLSHGPLSLLTFDTEFVHLFREVTTGLD